MGPSARIRDCSACAYPIRRGAASRDRLALSGVASAGAPGVGTLRVEANGEQAVCSLLSHYCQRQEAVGFRSQSMGADASFACVPIRIASITGRKSAREQYAGIAGYLKSAFADSFHMLDHVAMDLTGVSSSPDPLSISPLETQAEDISRWCRPPQETGTPARLGRVELQRLRCGCKSRNQAHLHSSW